VRIALGVIVAILAVGTVSALAVSPRHPAAVACPAGDDNRAASCRYAEATCREDPELWGHVGSADGDGFSDGWSCDHGALTSFTYG
jgi:hypothetical protein